MKTLLRLLTLCAITTGPLDVFGCVAPQSASPGADEGNSSEFIEAGLGVPMSIYPVRLLDRPNRDVGDALGLILENHGMTGLQPVRDAFEPDNESKWEDVPGQFAAFLKIHAPATKYALYAEILGSPKDGVDELRWLIVDVNGQLILSDQLVRGDRALKKLIGRHPEPMTCCVAVCDRLFARTGWHKGRAPKEGAGTFAQLWAEKSGTPSEAERQAMNQRLVHLKERLKDSRIVVLPTRIADRDDVGSASRLAHGISEALGISATALTEPVHLKIPGSPNEQRVLWDFARQLREHLRSHPCDADYILMADYLAEFDKGRIGAVHIIICDKAGDWVSVDFQNSHHPDFRRIGPKSIEDCDKLATERIEKQLK
ncbi:MAG: hypothetical protein KF841_07605 [Phycisphaerae bacterium]|nr:hypothetical protein [Phycisphaerae bacterium]